MKNKILLFMYLMFLSLQAAVPTTKEIYKNIKSAQDKYTPANLSGQVDSIVVRRQLKNIPPEHIKKDSAGKDKNPYVMLYFKKGYDFKLNIMNVSSYYKNMFTPYEDTLSKSGLFFAVGRHNTYASFIKKYKIYWQKPSEYSHRIKIVEKEALPGDYAVFYFNEKWQLVKSEYFENDKKLATALLEYEKVNNYQLPIELSIEIHDRKGISKVTFKFSDFTFKNLSPSLFSPN